MIKAKYLVTFGLLFLVLVALGFVCYKLCPCYYSRFAPGMDKTETMSNNNTSDQLSILNVAITVILFFLLAFSIINIYTFYNIQLDEERKRIQTQQDSIDGLITQFEGAEGTHEKDYLYELNLARLSSEYSPAFVKAAAAGFFAQHRLKDNDDKILKNIYKHLAKKRKKNESILAQLEEVFHIWGIPIDD